MDANMAAILMKWGFKPIDSTGIPLPPAPEGEQEKKDEGDKSAEEKQ